MKCTTVRPKLAAYLDDAVTGASHVAERLQIREHLDLCAPCRSELESYRKLAVLLSRHTRTVPPADLAVRIRVAAAQAKTSQESKPMRRLRDRAEILLDNVLRPLTVPATGGVFSAMLVFVLALQTILPGTTVRAVQNDVATNFIRPAELISLSEYPQYWATEPQHDVELALPHGLLVDVTVDSRGQMSDYHIISGPNSAQLRHQLDQILLFSRFSPMLSFGHPTTGHVILSFSAVQVRG